MMLREQNVNRSCRQEHAKLTSSHLNPESLPSTVGTKLHLITVALGMNLCGSGLEPVPGSCE
jgi:hypothetical protein